MPVIKLQQQVRKGTSGQVYLIDCTDSSAEKDIRSWCKVNRHTVMQVETLDFGCRIEVKKG